MISLSPMTEAEFKIFWEQLIPDYAADKVRSGNWQEEEALERSREECTKLLPQGVATPNQFLFTAKNSEAEMLGWFWLALDQGQAFIYDLYIYPAQRRKGYATQVMRLGEAEAKRLGCSKIGLHVFGFNQEAFALYQKLGYLTTNIVMAKTI